MQAQVVQVGTLRDFLAEIPLTSNRPVLRLSLVEQLTPRTYGQGKRSFIVPAKTVTLNLQGTNPQGEIVWLCESHEVTWCPDGPAFSTDQSVYEAMPRLHDLVKVSLERRGYEVRGGQYALPRSIRPLHGQFECVRWQKEGERWTVELAEAENAAENTQD